MENGTVFYSILENQEYLEKAFNNSMDVEYRPFIIPAINNADALLVFISNMADKKEIDEYILKPLMKVQSLPNTNLKRGKEISHLIKSCISVKQAKEESQWIEICDSILQGNAVLFIDRFSSAVILSTKQMETRSISEPYTEKEVRGPRDGFIENIAVNITLIRRRVKDSNLNFEGLKIGERTKTDVALVYIKNLVDDSILTELKTRLNRIKVDGILESGYIEEFIQDAPRSIFPTIEHTERPDKVCGAILEGRIAILTDNTPFALIVPTVFWNFIQTSGDYYDKPLIATFFRWIRFIALVLSFTLTSLYVLLASYHQEMLPTNFALKIAAGREGVPFPAIIEAFIMDIILELTKEAGLRMPSPIGQMVSIVGTFIMGQAAFTAGIAAPVLIIFVTIEAICSYAIPSYSMSNSFRLLRFGLLILSGTLGILGFFGGIIALLLHLLSLRSFGAPFFAPVIPYDKSGNKDVLNRAPWWKVSKRPGTGRPKDKVRQSEGLKPKPSGSR